MRSVERRSTAAHNGELRYVGRVTDESSRDGYKRLKTAQHVKLVHFEIIVTAKDPWPSKSL